jgi:4-amino-4-deoxy-L-arabinose transferase-like glycosyltransferase
MPTIGMKKITINKRSLLRILIGVYLFPLFLVCFSLSVPPGDLPLCGLMFVLAGFGFMLARRESRTWRLVWLIALMLSLLCGALEMVAGRRIAHQRLEHGPTNVATQVLRKSRLLPQLPLRVLPLDEVRS